VSGPVDVLAVMVRLSSLGGVVIPSYNTPRSTGCIRSFLRAKPRPKTADVLRALRHAEKIGDVEFVGPGAKVEPALNLNAAQARERYWRITDAALARVGGAA
jgi:hypothetical protein